MQHGNLGHPGLPALVAGGHLPGRSVGERLGGAGAVDFGHHTDPGLPLSVRRDDRAVGQGLRFDVGPISVDHHSLPDVLPGRPDGQGVTVRLAALFPTPLDPRLLDLEKIREIRSNAQLHHAFGGFSREVPDRDLLQDSRTQFAQPLHDQRAVRIPVRTGHPAGKQGAVRLLRLGRQRFDGLAVDGQVPAGQDPGVFMENPVRVFRMDVSVGRGNTER